MLRLVALAAALLALAPTAAALGGPSPVSCSIVDGRIVCSGGAQLPTGGPELPQCSIVNGQLYCHHVDLPPAPEGGNCHVSANGITCAGGHPVCEGPAGSVVCSLPAEGAEGCHVSGGTIVCDSGALPKCYVSNGTITCSSTDLPIEQ